MTPEIKQFIERTMFHLPVVRQMMELLPPDDGALDELLAEVVAANDLKAFMYVMTAAAGAERRMEARHLARGAMMFPDYRWLGKVAVRMHGDVAEHLLAAVQNTRLRKGCEAAALHLIAAWCQEHRGGVLPDTLIPAARALARRLKAGEQEEEDLLAFGLLLALAVGTKDSGLHALLRQGYPDVTDEKWAALTEKSRTYGEAALAAYQESILGLVRAKPNNALAAGTTMRRAVARVGRNEPCPCGSGKKYKRCCHDQDQEKLHHSSDVAGLTREELHAQMEEHLTAARLDQTEPYQLARLDPAKIPPALLETYFLRLTAFNLLDRAVEALETLGWSAPLLEGWDHVMFGAGRAGRRDVAQRLMRLREPHGFKEAELDLSYRLLLAGEEPARCLELIEENARKTLQTEDTEELLGLAYGVTISKFPALGILLYRGVFPLVPPDQAASSFEQLLQARDRLNLSPEDPISDLIDERLGAAKDEGKDAVALREAQRKLDGKAHEVRRLKESLEQMQEELARREKPAPSVPAPAAPVAPAEERFLKELREKVEALKSALKERHGERNELRRELQKAHSDLAALRLHATPATAPAEAGDGADQEEDLLLPQEAAGGGQPIRLIEFPRNFQQTLTGVPRHIARGALSMLGRLAGGEVAAFVGAVRLKACPTITRQRIGIDHRLLFRLLPDRIQVVDLIPRQDLERRIKTLV